MTILNQTKYDKLFIQLISVKNFQTILSFWVVSNFMNNFQFCTRCAGDAFI